MLSRGIARNGSRKSQDLEVLSNNLPSTHGQARRGAGGGGGGDWYSLIGPVAEQCLVLAHLYPNFTCAQWGGVVWISNDGNDRRIFWGLKFSTPEFFGVGKFGIYFVWWLGVSKGF